MNLARRIAVAVVTLVGLVVAVLGIWMAAVLGPSGDARFVASATGPVLIGPDVLGALDVPVTVSAHVGEGDSAATGVFIGASRTSDVTDVVGGARVQQVAAARFPARVLDLEPIGQGDLADPTSLDVWRVTARGSMDVADPGSTAVLVVPTTSDPVTVVLERHHPAWFVEAVVALVIGLLVAAAGTWWLVQQLGHRIPLGVLGRGRAARRPSARPARPARPVASGGFDEDEAAAAVPEPAAPEPALQEPTVPEPTVPERTEEARP